MKTTANTLMLICLLMLTTFSLMAQQQRYTVSGYVKDEHSGESLIGISIGKPGTSVGTVTNEYGFYSLTLPAGSHEIQYSYMGYKPIKMTIDLTSNKRQDIKLAQADRQLNEVVITSKQQEKNINTLNTSLNKLDIAEMKKLPTFMGEVDVLRAIQTLPGVNTVGEGAASFNVRGGAGDENLILMDEAPVYNSTHMLGFFSVFNPDAVKNINLIKGGFPAEYGGRTASVLDIRMKDGNNQKLGLTGGIGNIFSRLAVEGPIQKDKSSFIIAGRRSYMDVMMKPFMKGDMKDTKLYFYDLTAKVNFNLNKNNSLFVSGYFGRDVFGFGGQVNMNWGNTTTSVRWNHIFNNRLFMNLTTYYTKYDYSLEFKSKETDVAKQSYKWTSNIINYGIKPAFTYYINSNNTLHFGVQSVLYTFKPGKGTATDGETTNETVLKDKNALEGAVYLDHELKAGKFGVQYGVRLSGFQFRGKGTAYYYADTTAGIRKRLDHTQEFAAGKTIADYYFLEPRISAKYKLNATSAVKAAYSRSAQYMHQLSNTASPTPVDIWTPVTNNVKPQLTDQVTAGYFYNAPGDKFELSAEVFYKTMKDQLDFIDNSDLDLNEFIEADLLASTGRAYGLELYVKKDIGNTTGWVSYTLSRSERKTPGISQSEWFINRYDRTHNVNVVVSHEFTKRISMGANWVFASGTPATFADARLEFQDWDIPYNTTEKRNNYRLKPFHRLDLSVTWKGKQLKRWKGEWVFSLYNVYARRNAYTVYFRQNEDDPNKKEAVRLSIIGSIIPGITYNFKF
ncbi:TonB-dependent receptor plug domain-containing protein [Chitinophaga sp. SYP-B3965]|uniref:TonB-dependent receptor n=1 Tax=Chitinophaga sp. SYP-B3965 TaxID=2663120 RepID=UPI0012997695|nr:TonB-dependent receptor [Chitinophaga sp. SYP-B3965]MRG45580.1 TonB-dependent receptor plug domain-containing protein [Chitinophaga sp. SYP-B3965]